MKNNHPIMGRLLLGFMAILLALPLLAACDYDSESPDQSEMLENTEWVLVSINDDDVLTDTEITLAFMEDRIGGSAGCNTYMGGVEVDGLALSFSPIASTMMACVEESVMNQETAFLAVLQVAESFSIENDQLIITSAEGGALVFDAK
jgi:heat shock protein HslJ